MSGPADNVLAGEFEHIADACRRQGFHGCTAGDVAAVYGQNDGEVGVDLLEAIEELLWERGIW